MLIECPECKKQVSDHAMSCPRCGHPLRASDQDVSHTTARERNGPVFLVLSVIALFLMLNTPRLLLFFPLMATLGCAAISVIRKENFLAWADCVRRMLNIIPDTRRFIRKWCYLRRPSIPTTSFM